VNELAPTVLINPRPDYAGEVAQKVFPPVGLMYLVAALRKAGQPVRLIDANAMRLDDDGVLRMLDLMEPFAVGLPVFAGLLPATASLVRAIRLKFPTVPIFAGGAEATVNPEGLTRWIPEIDHVLCGEAEESIVEYILAMRSGVRPRGIAGLFTPARDGAAPGAATVPARILDLDRVPVPDRECVGENYRAGRYYTLLVPDRRLDCIVTSRGCPHRCRFCYNWRFRQTCRSIDGCLDEVSRLYDGGVRTIEILDDNFTAERDRAVEFFGRVIAEKWPLRFRIKARADAIDGELIRIARRAGVYQVSLGVESGSPEMLRAMRKRITPETAAAAIATIMDHGMYCHASFIVGFPGENPDTMDQTVRFIKATRPTTVGLDVLSPYQGTDVYEQARADGTLVGDWTTDPAAGQPWIRLDWTKTRQDLLDARKSMLFRIYWNRTYIGRYAKMIVGGINPTMGRYLVQEAARTWPGLGGLARGIGKKKDD